MRNEFKSHLRLFTVNQYKRTKPSRYQCRRIVTPLTFLVNASPTCGASSLRSRSLSRSLGLSRRAHNLVRSAVWESLRDLLLFSPTSALDSLRFFSIGVGCTTLPTVVIVVLIVCVLVSLLVRPHGKLRAKSAKVSRRFSGAFGVRLEPPPLHSRRMSVSWAKELRRRRGAPAGEVLGGELSGA